MKNLESLVEMKKEYDEKIKQDGKSAIRKELDGFFEDFPEIESIKWTQYTPHFNDGSECTFSVNEPSVKLKGDKEYKQEYEFSSTYQRTPSKDDLRISKGLSKLHKQFEKVEDVFESVFGDHSEITVQSNGKVEIEEYEHD